MAKLSEFEKNKCKNMNAERELKMIRDINRLLEQELKEVELEKEVIQRRL